MEIGFEYIWEVFLISYELDVLTGGKRRTGSLGLLLESGMGSAASETSQMH